MMRDVSLATAGASSLRGCAALACRPFTGARAYALRRTAVSAASKCPPSPRPHHSPPPPASLSQYLTPQHALARASVPSLKSDDKAGTRSRAIRSTMKYTAQARRRSSSSWGALSLLLSTWRGQTHTIQVELNLCGVASPGGLFWPQARIFSSRVR